MVIASELKKILENNKDKFSHDYVTDLRAMPQEEAVIFLTALREIDKLLLKFDPSWLKLSPDEIKKWGMIYLLLHDLMHNEFSNSNDNDLTKLEILTTAPIFTETQKSFNQEIITNLTLAYFLLGVGGFKINHSLPFLISEKIILGEFISVGGLDSGVWGIKLKPELLPGVAFQVLEKTQKNTHNFLVKKYKNFVCDFL